jgi:hypothetical protein
MSYPQPPRVRMANIDQHAIDETILLAFPEIGQGFQIVCDS